MKFSLYNKKNQLDEMQEQTMLSIEARGFWLLWAGLLLAILVQMVLRTPSSQWVGEFVVFMAGCIYTMVECLRNGFWDRHISANTPTNVLISLFAGVVVAVVIGLAYGYWLIALIPGVITGVLSFVLLQVCMHVAEKRRHELDNPTDDKDDE